MPSTSPKAVMLVGYDMRIDVGFPARDQKTPLLLFSGAGATTVSHMYLVDLTPLPIVSVPEPSTLTLVLGGWGAWMGRRHHRQRMSLT